MVETSDQICLMQLFKFELEINCYYLTDGFMLVNNKVILLKKIFLFFLNTKVKESK